MRRPQAYRLAAHDRRIAVALLVSLLLHTPLLLPPGTFSIGPASESSAPELRIELQGVSQAEAIDDQPREDRRPSDEASLVAATASPEPLETEEPSPVLEEQLARVPPEASEPDEELTGIDESSAAPVEGGTQQLADTSTDDELSSIESQGEAPTPSKAAMAQTGFEEIIGEVTTPEETASAPMASAGELPMAVRSSVADAPVSTIAPAEVRDLKRLLEDEARDLLASSAMQRELEFANKDRKYVAALRRQPAADGMGVERVTVELATEQGAQRVQTSLQLKRLAFSHFTQLVDRWDTQVQLHDDEIAGRFHSNSIINLTYDHQVAPRLLGLVTTARYIRIAGEKGWRPRSKIFVGGLKTNTPRIRLPPVVVPMSQGAVDNADVHVLHGDTLIVFRAEGAYDATDLASRAISTHTIAPGRPLYIAGMGEPELQVRGVVNGSVTVYSPRDIVIQGNLTYARDPRSDDADDYLGLVSDHNVEIARADVTGPGDLQVQAAIYARNRFVVRNVGARGGGTMFVYGSITAGSMSETEPRYGTRTDFDVRFEKVRPPGFPETDRYEVESWNERWHLAEGEPVGNP